MTLHQASLLLQIQRVLISATGEISKVTNYNPPLIFVSSYSFTL